MVAVCRRPLLVAGLLLAVSRPAAAEPPAESPQGIAGILLPTDSRTARLLEAAAEYAKAEDWKEAIRLVQHVLDGREDVLVPRKGQPATLVRAAVEAQRLLAGLPPAGRELYEKTHGPAAAEMLREARKLEDAARLAEVARRYLYTAAGPEALQDLARGEFRAGHWRQAALRYGALGKHQGAADWTTEDLYQAALAARRVNREGSDERLLRELLARAGAEGVRVDGRTLTREQLRAEVEPAPASPPAGEWPLYRGNPARTNQGAGGPAALEPRWKHLLFQGSKKNPAAEVIAQAQRRLAKDSQPLLPGSFSLAVTVTEVANKQRLSLILFRDYWGLQAIDARTGKLAWNSPSSWSLEQMLDPKADPRKVQALSQWLKVYQTEGPSLLFENSIIGTPSTDGQYVYVVEDFAVPPPAQVDPGPRELMEAIHHNRLQAYSLPKNGKLIWEAGSFGEKNDPLTDTFFLGPPLPVRGLLYVLTEKRKELRLVCLDPRANGKLVFTLALGRVGKPLDHDPMRRTQAAHLAYSDGVLVVPTNAGAVFGIDLEETRLAWVHEYRGKDAPAAARGKEWKVTAPAIHDGKVVFTAPDGDAVCCLDLHDGSSLWTHRRQDDDLYFAGIVKDRVLMVGRKNTRALSLAKGETRWTLETGLPSGQGIASGRVYYLPLREAAGTRAPGISAIDAGNGTIVSTHSCGKDVPGNLIFAGGDVVSLSAEEVAAYPQTKVRAAQVEELLKKNPNDPAGLTERASLRLDRDDLAGAVEDLRKVLDNDAPAEVRARANGLLVDALVGTLRRDFPAAEASLKDLEKLLRGALQSVDRPQHVQVLMLVGRGREKQGKLSEALDAYLDVAALDDGSELLPAADEPGLQVRLSLWARGRIEGLFWKADPEQRKQLEEAMEHRRKKAEAGKGLADLRAFVMVIGPGTPAGRAARLALAGRLIESEAGADLEAELLLEEVRRQREDPPSAAAALEMLARLNTRRGRLEDAVYDYRILGRDFPKVVLPDGKTGAEVLESLGNDKRFLPLLEEPRRRPAGPLKVSEHRENLHVEGGFDYVFAHAAEPLPFFGRHALTLNFPHHSLRLIDAFKGEEKWSLYLPETHFDSLFRPATPPVTRQFSYQALGHLIVLPLGQYVFAIDPETKKVLWRRNLIADPEREITFIHPENIQVDSRDGSVRLTHREGWAQCFGRPLVMAPSALCLMTGSGLIALHPLTGKPLWQRAVPSCSEVFGNADVVAVVERNAEGKATATRVLRSADGTSLDAPDFAALYDKHLRIQGTRLLLSEKGPPGVTLRLYDVLTGADVWKHTFSAGSLVLRCRDERLTGAVAPDGTLTVIDLGTKKPVLNTRLDVENLDRAEAVHLLADAAHFIVAVRRPAGQSKAQPEEPPLTPQTGMEGLRVNGEVYAFDRESGKPSWQTSVPDSVLVLNHFAEMPLFLFCSRTRKVGGPVAPNQVVRQAAVLAIDKQTGRRLYEKDQIPAGRPFHALQILPDAIEFASYNLKLRFTPAESAAKP